MISPVVSVVRPKLVTVPNDAVNGADPPPDAEDVRTVAIGCAEPVSAVAP